MGKSRRLWGGKGKVVWPGGSRRRPMGDQDALSDRYRRKGEVGWPGGTRRDLTGDGSSQPGWVRLSGRRMEKASFLLGGSGRK